MNRDRANPAAIVAALARVFWLPGVVILVHLVLAGERDYYTRYEFSDELMHPIGGFAIAVMVSRALVELTRRNLAPDPGALLRRTLVFSLTATAAVLWEFYEFLSDRYLGTRTLGDLTDTLRDLALGLGGGVLFLVLDALTATETTRRGRWLVALPFLGVVVLGPALVWRGGTEQWILVMASILWLGLPLMLLGGLLSNVVARQSRPGVRRVGHGLLWAAAGVFATIGSLPIGIVLVEWDMRAAKLYWEHWIPELEEYRLEEGEYPRGVGQSDSWSLRSGARLGGTYWPSEDGQSYSFSITDPRGLFVWQVYDSERKGWREMRD